MANCADWETHAHLCATPDGSSHTPLFQADRYVPHAIIPVAPSSVGSKVHGHYLGVLLASVRSLPLKQGLYWYRMHGKKLDAMATALEVAKIPPAVWLKFRLGCWQCTRQSAFRAMPLSYLYGMAAYNKHNGRVANMVGLYCPARIVFPPASRRYWQLLITLKDTPESLATATAAAQRLQAQIDEEVEKGMFMW